MTSPYDLPTVKIESGNSYAVINESDFDAKVHKIWTGVEIEVEKVAAVVEKTVEKVAAKIEEKTGWGAAPPPSA